MKDIFDYMNEIDIDESELIQCEVSEFERKRGKDKLKKSLNINNKRKYMKASGIVAASLLVATTSLVIAKPTWAADIPVIGDLIRVSLEMRNGKYEEYVDAIGKSTSDKGIDITFESCAMDDNKFFLQFVVKNNNEKITEDNISEALIIPSSFDVNGKTTSGGAGAKWERIDDNTVRILKSIDIARLDFPNKMNIDIKINELFGETGNWSVRFNVDKEDIAKETMNIDLNRVINIDGQEIRLDKLKISSLSTSLLGRSQSNDRLSFIAFDDKGRNLTWTGESAESVKGEYKLALNWDFILEEDATNVSFIPVLTKQSDSGLIQKSVEKLELDNFSNRVIELDNKRTVEIIDLVREGEFVIVKYSNMYEGKKYIGGDSAATIYIESNGSKLEMEHNDQDTYSELINKYHSNEYEIDVFKVADLNNLKMGVQYSEESTILEDNKFTVKIK